MGRGLSPQESLILNILADEGGGAWVTSLSRAVAEALDVQGSRIQDPEGVIPEADVWQREAAPLGFQLHQDFYIKRRKRLTPSHRASFSRSLRRLEDRGLVVLYKEDRYSRRTRWVHLTPLGASAVPKD